MRDDSAEMDSGGTLEVASSAGRATLALTPVPVPVPAPVPDPQHSARKLHLALRRRAVDARRKEARRERRRKECEDVGRELGGLRDLQIEDVEDEEDGDVEKGRKDKIFENRLVGGG
ncbi:uncharacterized protein EAF01_004527 [Botrytis porri]|uniref:Uncharacterized protein n=1 Tax=Botrytis porri TaxID=87229 RepID=A0A4Z1KTH3_9HELO|nr:uncharacterized protein EAF01_004527 [Botrytis porri]KAF7908772.1 hypothetical protein EAF01_004527 [Botrytis porri]TGO87525.1 hypothetical protein BPOR_0220g00030 [Botrytis porri]